MAVTINDVPSTISPTLLPYSYLAWALPLVMQHVKGTSEQVSFA